MAISWSTLSVEAEDPAVTVSMLDGISVPEAVSIVPRGFGVLVRDGIEGPQAAIKVTIINMANTVVIFFIILNSPLFIFCEGMKHAFTVGIDYSKHTPLASVRRGELPSAIWGIFLSADENKMRSDVLCEHHSS